MKDKTKILKNSKILYASTPILIALAILWNKSSGGLYTNYVIGGAFLIGIIGIWREVIK